MKGVLFLGVVGIAIYTALVVTHDFLPSYRTAGTSAWQKPDNLDVRPTTSWGTDLAALVPSHQPSLPKRKPAVPEGEDESAQNLALGSVPGVLTSSMNTAYEPIEWVKVMLAARVHREASVSSPTMRFYQPGTALQVVNRDNGWVQINDPTSREGGWVLEQYLVPTDGKAVTQMAAATPTALSEPTQAKPVPRAKKRASRPAVRVPVDVATAQFDTRWERRAERRRGFGLFFFGRYARTQPAAPYANRAWLVGSE